MLKRERETMHEQRVEDARKKKTRITYGEAFGLED